jgi:hypothetical protein
VAVMRWCGVAMWRDDVAWVAVVRFIAKSSAEGHMAA